MQLTIRLAEVFLDTPGGVLSIHQISKRLGIPYGTAYNRIHEMEELGCVQIVPQGKAKLCALNPANPMTANLLGLGASQTTHRFLTSSSLLAPLTAKLRGLIEARLGERLHAALLLNFDAFQAAAPALTAGEGSDLPTATAAATGEWTSPTPEEGAEPLALDLFLVMTEEGAVDPQLELGIHSIFPPHLHPRVTTMTVSDATLLGMLREKENEAGLAAYHMLRRALLLQGFERFFTLILKAFPPRLL